MSVQSFLLRQAMKWKMKGVPAEKRDELMNMVEKDPELFKKIGDEVERRKKGGETEMKATVEVMKKYRVELTALAQKMILALASLLILVHALGAALGAAGATYAEVIYTKATADGKVDSREREYFATTYWVLRFGMTTTLFSGLVLIVLQFMLPLSPDASFYAPLWMQNTLALVITATGYAMTRKKIRWWLGSALVFAGWWYMLVLDVSRNISLSYTTLVFFYAVLTVLSAAGWGYARTRARERYEARATIS